jgi:hypothetical protein
MDTTESPTIDGVASPMRGWRPVIVAALLCAGVASAFGIRYAAFMWVSGIGYKACLEQVPGATPAKCRCWADMLTEEMLSYQYIYRRLVRDEGLSEEEINRSKKACGLPLS